MDGCNINGFLLIDKEKGYTSFDVCNKLKHKFKFKKVGHNGTLDPNATGLMVIGVNDSTKLLFKLDDSKKEYIASVLFGMSSKTLDIEGEIISKNLDVNVDYDSLVEAINILKAEKEQIPPMFSAIKVNGNKLYDLARKNINIELEPRAVEIFDISVVSDFYYESGFQCVDIKMSVSKGFYVRSFVRDLCKILDCDGLLFNLRRTKNGIFDVKNAKKIDIVTLDDIFSVN